METHNIDKIESAVTIEVFTDGSGYIICDWSNEFGEKLMNGTHPEDNFDNCDLIPSVPGKYLFDVEYAGGADFNGESTEYWMICKLVNCKKK